MSIGTAVVTRDAAKAAPSQHRPNIQDLFEAQVRRTPDAVALNDGPNKLTYRELHERSNQLAHHLRACGVEAETPVALYLDRSLEMVVAILGVLKAGGTYVPIDLAYPKDRATFMIEDAAAPILLTQAKLRGDAPAHSAKVIAIDEDWPAIAASSSETPITNVTGENAAYIIYTSGSTGKPKGVIVTHQNVIRLLKQTSHWYGFNSSDVWPLFHSYAFDVSVWELWASLLHGGRLVIVPYLVSRTPHEFYDLVARERVTVLNQTPSAFRQFIWAEETAPVRRDLNLRYVICAGEALELQSLRPWFARHGDKKPLIVNMYGITETTVHSTYRVIREADLNSGVGSVIGVPIPDLQIHLVDEDLKPVPTGVPGEICVGGAGVARGYLNRPELTSKRFIPDPFSSEPGARLYRSGDLAQYTITGELEYLGRMDHQVKIRGFRVELGEIESALNRHPALRESVVIAHEAAAGEKRLVAYVVPVAAAPTVSELRECLLQKLPDYMVPALFVPLKSLPLTTNGKVDRRALPSPETARLDLGHSYVAPRNRTEEILAQTWSKVLEVERVGVEDNFFELGGDSIRSIRILAQAQQAGLSLTLEQMFEHPTVAGLAPLARACAESTGPSTIEPFSLISQEDRAKCPPDVEDAYPIAKLQLGMFFRNELDPVSAMYHDVFSFRISAPLNSEALEEALKNLIARHPTLRTSFHLAGFSEPMQMVHRTAPLHFTKEDLTALPEQEQARRIADWVEAEKRRPFERAEAPLVRFHVQQLAPKCFQFIFSFHHSCLDGWSLAAAVTQIFEDYKALLDGAKTAAAKPRLGYRDFIGLERASCNSETTRRFWTEAIADATLQTLPRWPKSLRASAHEQLRGPELQIAPTLLEGLRRVASGAGVPLKSVLLAAHQHVMGYLYGQKDVTTGLIANGRPEDLDGEALIGLFLNAVPFRMQLQGGTWQDLVKATFAAEQKLLSHRRFPLAEIQKLNGSQPLFEAVFDFVHFHVYKNLEARTGFGFAEGHYFEANDMTTYTTFMLDASSNRLELHIDYDPNTIARQQIEEITWYYIRVLEAMATEPTGRYEQFLPMSEAERNKILKEWNQTAAEYPAEQCIHELIEARAATSPDATAVIFEEQSLTYRQLNEKADAFAHRLREAGVGPEVLVGLCLERSVEMLVALLGILKAGGAYVPLDPAFPAERLAFMLEDSKAPVLVTMKKWLGTFTTSSAVIFCLDEPVASPATGRNSQPAGSENKNGHPANGAPQNPPMAAGPQPAKAAGGSPLAYTIYTSGSTGKPKGVQIEHRSVVNLLLSARQVMGITSRDKLLAVTTLSFDIAGLEIFTPLISGGCLLLANREQASDGTRLAQLMQRYAPTVMQGTPATWRLLLEAGWAGDPNLKVICGGEALKPDLAAELCARTAGVWNFYGPTETTIWSTAMKVVPGEPISIGRPLANTDLYIVDSWGRPVPVGVAGELCIGGDGVARGYLNRPELTAEKFIANPFASVPEAETKANEPASSTTSIPAAARPRIYKTGDLARYMPDGNVECLGRNDHQAKIRGFRIELGEIETVLRQHPTVADTVVTAREDSTGEKRLVSYIISKNGPPASSELRDFVRSKLPAYMTPAHFVVLKEFPRTPNGKLDMRRLPAPGSDSTASRAIRPPKTEDEHSLAAIWTEVLELKDVGVDDNFFDLGGDSLSATRAFARINRQFGADLTLKEMLEQPTISLLAKTLENRKSSVRVGPRITRQARPTHFSA